MRFAILVLALLFALSHAIPATAQRDYPATATIRGENIWLRVDPAEDTEIIGYVQRGDQIRVTGDAVPADGDAFYPIEVVETGEAGWVRDLAVDPRSFTPLDDLPEVVVEEVVPEVEEGAEIPAPTEVSRAEGRCESVPADVVAGIESGLMVDGGGSLRGAQAVRSRDYDKVWFVAADIQAEGLEGDGDIGVWALNDISVSDLSLIFAADEVAKAFSDWGSAGGAERFSVTDEGVSEARECVASAL